jgi:hypothetical protein
MRFPYQPLKLKNPVPSFPGATHRQKPIIPVDIIAGGYTHTVNGLLDTGADDTVFPNGIATVLGIDLTNAPGGVFQGVDKSHPLTVLYASVLLRFDDGNEVFEWQTVVGFANVKLALLGIAGCLQFFDTQFLGSTNEVFLQPNSSFPGTIQQIP